MAMPAWVPEAWNALSEDNQKQAGDFLRFLLEQQNNAQEVFATEASPKPMNYGVLKGHIKVPEGFDDPLPEFKEYM